MYEIENRQNKSSNFIEMVKAVQEGREVQWWYIGGEWRDSFNKTSDFINLIKELVDNLGTEWRIKPDAFQQWWEHNCEGSFDDDKSLARHAWKAAMEYKEKNK